MRRALVTGGTGFLGRNLVERLVADGWRVFILKRSAGPEREAENVSFVRGDLADPSTLASAIPDNLDCLFHLAGDTSFWRLNNARQHAINVEGARHLMNAALRKGVARVVHTSTVGVYGTSFRDIDESSPRPGSASPIGYIRSKSLADDLVLKAIDEGLPATILNPCSIVGRYDTHNWSRLIRMVHDGSLPGAPPGSTVFCHAGAVAQAHIDAVDRAAVGERYILPGPHASYLDFIACAGRLLDRSTPARPTPAGLLKAMGAASLLASYVTRREPDLTPEGAEIVCGHQSVASLKASRELGYVSPSLEQMIADAVDWMRKDGRLAS
ncbi:MAG: NAD-dependent epimerase/dehydratase family protein [Porphyrobacter sp.]|nr:NAD-dependent epimerase/dehydratase family protein [Porphyrobacter sp.]